MPSCGLQSWLSFFSSVCKQSWRLKPRKVCSTWLRCDTHSAQPSQQNGMSPHPFRDVQVGRGPGVVRTHFLVVWVKCLRGRLKCTEFLLSKSNCSAERAQGMKCCQRNIQGWRETFICQSKIVHMGKLRPDKGSWLSKSGPPHSSWWTCSECLLKNQILLPRS